MVAVAPIDPLDSATLPTLPVDGDEGFPQAFLLGLGERTYRIELYLNVAESELPGRGLDPKTVIDVSGRGDGAGPRGALIGAVIRQDADHETVLLRRRLLPGLAYQAVELSLVLDTAAIAVGNLNGAGPYGSVINARVGAR
ncbi:MAG TPA: hypothetical protein VFN19_11285 [Candidatus Nanopelagicales bacterium]|nr:hypothetical protein [Candidatus Nanopelagicales bacterium]